MINKFFMRRKSGMEKPDLSRVYKKLRSAKFHELYGSF
jgi:hypothetical protein